ncbi:7449_t:CDS:2, partial [Funneliformis caledonium]
CEGYVGKGGEEIGEQREDDMGICGQVRQWKLEKRRTEEGLGNAERRKLTAFNEGKEIPMDVTAEIVKKLVQPPGQLPNKTFLNDFLNEKPEVKIPLSPAHFSQIYTKGHLIYPPSVGMNEDSFHAFWDDIIKNSIEIFGKNIIGLETMKFDRNTNIRTSTGRNRPDMVILVRNICPFRGEEKAADSDADSSKELTKKFKEWIYGDAPYLLAYHATGRFVTFVTLYESEPVNIGSSKKRTRSEVKSEMICEFNLESFSHRIRVMNLLRNTCRILPTIVNLCPARDTPDFITLLRPNGTIVELGYNVKKIFREERSIDHLREIYTTLYQNNVRFTDKLEYTISHSAHLEPRGLQRKPGNLNELLKALICILTCLKDMHGIKPKPILHRDVRWPNIVQHHNEYKKFILIDFDYATLGSDKRGI